MALTFRAAVNDADLTAIGALFNAKVPAVTGTSIVDELFAEGWPNVLAFTLAVWRPILADVAHNHIFMGFDGQGVLRGAGWWHLAGDTWEVKLIGLDKTLTAQQRTDGLHDFFQWHGGNVPATTQFSGLARDGGRIDQYLGSRLPASARRVVLDKQGNPTGLVEYRCTAADAVALL